MKETQGRMGKTSLEEFSGIEELYLINQRESRSQNNDDESI